MEDVTTWKKSGLQRQSVLHRKKKRILKRTKPEKPKEFNMGTFDIETDGLGGAFIIGCITTELGEYEFVYSAIQLLKSLLKYKGYIMYAHNGAKFDFLYLAQDIKELRYTHEIGVIRQGEKIIGFILEEHASIQERRASSKKDDKRYRWGADALQLRDSLPLLNNSLYNATKSFSPEFTKLKGDIDFEGGEKFDPSNESHMNYLKRDCDGLLATMRKFYELCYDLFNVYPSWTAGGTAMKAWKCKIPKGHCYSEYKERRKEEFTRQAYYGGYVFPGRSSEEHTDVKSVDYNAAYAASMLEGVPVGEGVWTGTFINTPGFWHVKVTTPQTDPYFPVIGKHAEKGLLWPLGTFETHCTTEEIVYAEGKGYTFEIIEGLVFDRIEFPFDEFITICQEIERTPDPETGKVDPARKNIAKQLRNSLYGKFCMRREIETLVISEQIPDGAMPVYSPNGRDIVEGMYTVKEENDADYLIPSWGAYVTMRQRLRLFRGMDAVKTPYYCDTDSIKAPASNVNAVVRPFDPTIPVTSVQAQEAIREGYIPLHPTTYGCAKDEGTFSMFQVLAPKTYHGTLSDGHHEMKAKGAPARELKRAAECPLCQASRGIFEPIYFASGHSLEKTLRDTSAPLFEERKRRISNIENSYAWLSDNKGNILPIRLNEF